MFDQTRQTKITAIMLAALTVGGASLAVAAPPRFSPPTPLHEAAKRGDAAEVMQLIVAGAEIDTIERYHQTPLQMAVAGGHAEVAELLLAGGADPDGNVEENELNNRLSPLFVATWRGDRRIAKLLLDFGADVNAIATTRGYGTWYQSTPLHQAARRGHVQLVRLYLDRGADVNYGVWDGEMLVGKLDTELPGQTPLHFAARSGHVEIAKRLIHRGADLHARSFAGQTALDLARQASQEQVVELLIAHGAQSQGAE